MDFTQQSSSRYYLPSDSSGNGSFLCFILPVELETPEPTISLQDALTNDDYKGSFVFSAQSIDKKTEADENNFIEDIYNNIIKPAGLERGIVWLTDPNNISSNTASVMGLDNKGEFTSAQFNASLAPTLTFSITTGIPLSLDEENSVLNFGTSVSTQKLFFQETEMKQTTKGAMNFSGEKNGCILFSTHIQASSLNDKFNWGFQYLYSQDDPTNPPNSEWLPFASGDGASGADYIGFDISVDPSDPYNTANVIDLNQSIIDQYDSRRTYFDFTGTNFGQPAPTTQLASYYRTVFGDNLTLIPKNLDSGLCGRMVLTAGIQTSPTQSFMLAPEGDFLIQNGSSPDGAEVNMICGLQGTEFFTVTTGDDQGKGDLIRFISQQPAFSDKFPFQPTSPVASPPDADKAVLSTEYTTSWATIVPQSSTSNESVADVMYVAQPKGSALFGTDSVQSADSPVYGHTTPGFIFNPSDKTEIDVVFPMAPYSGIGNNGFSAENTALFESQILSGQRRDLISKASGGTNKSALFTSRKLASTSGSLTTATPSGLVVDLSGTDGNYTWDKVILGQNLATGTTMSFNNPDPTLVQALQTSDLFLVAANNKNIGTDEDLHFSNKMEIGDWGIKANVGSNESKDYNDYRNIMIVKGRKGALYVPEEGTTPASGLVMNSDQWTNSNTFANPDPDTPDSGELIIVSQWIQSYFKEAAAQTDNDYFKKFNTIAIDENWTGILYLRADIDKLPTNLVGIMAGVRYPENFNAHHFAIEISPLHTGSNGPELQGTSSMFGLIYYEDKKFKNESSEVEPVRPDNSNKYDFCLLTLKVLFENTSVKNFESYAQLTLNELYGSRVTGMGGLGNSLNTIVLNGSLQITNGKPLYAMGSSGDNFFELDNNVLKRVEITNVLLTTLDDGQTSGNIITSFSLSGFLDFALLKFTLDPENDQGTDLGIFDIFSFGNNDGESESRKGLNYSNLGIQMAFSVAEQEAAQAANKQVVAKYTFNTAEITFDVAKSTPRDNSMYSSLALDMQSLVIGNGEEDPSKLGYLQVLSDYRLESVGGDDWYGLRFQLNMGSPGELAGKVNLTSYLLTAWTPNSTGSDYKAQLGIMLPGTGGGAKLISLQSVMTLSIGQIKMVYTNDAFLLMLTEIALKFFGMLKVPPAGSTLFYLFGNPQNIGDPSGLGWYAQYSNKKDNKSSNADALEKLSK